MVASSPSTAAMSDTTPSPPPPPPSTPDHGLSATVTDVAAADEAAAIIPLLAVIPAPAAACRYARRTAGAPLLLGYTLDNPRYHHGVASANEARADVATPAAIYDVHCPGRFSDRRCPHGHGPHRLTASVLPVKEKTPRYLITVRSRRTTRKTDLTQYVLNGIVILLLASASLRLAHCCCVSTVNPESP